MAGANPTATTTSNQNAPYWGQLPSPKISAATQHHARRLSSEEETTSPYQPPTQQYSQSAVNSYRLSSQTTNTDAPTDSTFSPLASPLSPFFPAHGLAPRPPSMTYPETLEKRRRRASQNHEADDEYAAAALATPPSAPDVPRGPPLSYRPPYIGLGQLYTIPPVRQSPVDLDWFKSPTPDRISINDHPVLGRAKRTMDSRMASQDYLASVGSVDLPPREGDPPTSNGPSREGSLREFPSHKHRRRTSSSSAAAERVLVDDRSPLQKLELSLKDQKRARVLAAEEAMRDRAAAAAVAPETPVTPSQQSRLATATQPPQQQLYDRRPSTSYNKEVIAQSPPSSSRQSRAANPTKNAPDLSRTAQLEATVKATLAAPSQQPLRPSPHISQASAEARRRRGSVSHPARSHSQSQEIAAAAVSATPPESPTEKLDSGGLQRNLSFRERAAKATIALPRPGEEDAGASVPISNRQSQQRKSLVDAPMQDGLSIETAQIDVRTRIPEASPIESRFVSPRPLSNGNGMSVYTPMRTSSYRALSQSYVDASIPSSTGVVALQTMPEQPPQQTVPPPDYYQGIPPAQKPQPQPQPQQRLLQQSHNQDGQSGGGGPGPASAATVTAPRPPSYHEAATDTSKRHDSNQPATERAHVKFQPDQAVYQPPIFLSEWRKAPVGTLTAPLLDLTHDSSPYATSTIKTSRHSRPRKAEAFDGEYDETNAPTRFKPPLYLKCGPLLRFCGIRTERVTSRATRSIVERDVWRGTVMIVTHDAESSYDIAPTLRLFVQPIDLLPPPPAEIRGEQALPPEYIDPIVGHPKLGRTGETLYVRPIEVLDQGKDLSQDETDRGLFETTRTDSDSSAPPGSFAARKSRIEADGEKVGRYKDVRGFRLHAERGCTFWRFNIEVELGDTQQRIAYRINRGPATGFWVPARDQAMNIMFHSGNGFGLSTDRDSLSGPDPMWRDVLNTHQSQPFHLMLGGGSQIFNDSIMHDTRFFKEWLVLRDAAGKEKAPFTAQMQDELESFFFQRYCTWFSQGLFSMANAQIPMVNMYDDREVMIGFGSYPASFMSCPVFSGLGSVGFKYYMLFQHQTVLDETDATEPSWTLGVQPSPYIHELSRSLFMSLGSKVALLSVDCRTERTRDEVVSVDTWKKIMDRCYAEIVKDKTEHLLVLLGVPIAYPRLAWLENIMTSRLIKPLKAVGRVGLLGDALNNFEDGVDLLDDVDDHWTSKNHKHERSVLVEDLQDLAADRSCRVTILSGDVHLAALGQFYSNPKLNVAQGKDFRYMINVISSPMVNTPAPNLIADLLNKRNKVHHFDRKTDEAMVPIFDHGVEGKPRNNKHLLPHRNWCSITPYVRGSMATTPRPTSPVTRKGRGSIIRRLSQRARRASVSDAPPLTLPSDQDRSRPPISSSGLFRTFSRNRRASVDTAAEAGASESVPTFRRGSILRRFSLGSRNRPRADAVNGRWASASEDVVDFDDHSHAAQPHPPATADAAMRGMADDGLLDMNIPKPVVADYPQNPYMVMSTAAPHGQSGMGLRGGAGPRPSVDMSMGMRAPIALGDDFYHVPRSGRGMHNTQPHVPRQLPQGEYEEGDERHFVARLPQRAYTQPPAPTPGYSENSVHLDGHPPRSTTLARATTMTDAPLRSAGGGSLRRSESRYQQHQQQQEELRKAEDELEAQREGGLVICLNVEINPKDPAGITLPYKLVVPRLTYEYEGEDGSDESPDDRGENRDYVE